MDISLLDLWLPLKEKHAFKFSFLSRRLFGLKRSERLKQNVNYRVYEESVCKTTLFVWHYQALCVDYPHKHDSTYIAVVGIQRI